MAVIHDGLRTFAGRELNIEQHMDKERILRFVGARRYRPMTSEQIAEHLSVGKDALQQFVETLHELQLEGSLVETRERRWADPEREEMTIGRLHCNPEGFGFVIPAGEGEDVYVAQKDMSDALHNDVVVVQREQPKRRWSRRPLGPAGRVVRVLKRANEEVIGTFKPGRKWSCVMPDDPRLCREVQIPPGKEGGAGQDDKVLVHLTKWPEPGQPGSSPEGDIVRVLGKDGAPGVDVESIILEFGLPHEFSERALKQAEAVPLDPPDKEKQKRRDLRRYPTAAIDPEDAWDRDDALSMYVDRHTGNRVVLVHIADVSRVVHPDSALDEEARERGCSVYLVSDFVPMLPRQLTQQVLSFTEDKDRLAKTVILEFDADAERVNYSICHSVVRTDVATTYREVRELLEAAESEDETAAASVMAKWPQEVAEMTIGMDELAQQLRRRRRRIGSVDLDVPEYDVRVAEDGRVSAVSQIERDRSHSLVEEFMLAANCAVAEFLKAHKLPGLYRTHEKPDEEHLQAFREFIQNVLSKDVDPFDRSQLQDLLAQVAGTKLAEAVNMELLRCMKRALYGPKVAPHFALHFDTYSHFTSPIRRYPDLVVHQILDQYLAGKLKSSNVRARWESILPAIADSANQSERRADEAEREIVKIKLLRFLSERSGPAGEVFDAVITGVQEYGFFAQLQRYSVEGLVKVASLKDDLYHFDEGKRALTGKKTGRTFRLGQAVQVTIDDMDLRRRQMDLKLKA